MKRLPCLLQVLVLVSLARWSLSLKLKLQNHNLYASTNISLTNKDSFSLYNLKPERWEFKMIPYNEGKSCFLRLRYDFEEDLLLRFEKEPTSKPKSETVEDMFVMYVSPGISLNAFDIYLDEPVFTLRVCRKEVLKVYGIENIEKEIGSWGFDEEILESLLATPVNLSSLSIADYVSEYPRVYENLLKLGNFNSNATTESIYFDQEKDSLDPEGKAGQDLLASEVAENLRKNFTFFVNEMQIGLIQDKKKENPSIVNNMIIKVNDHAKDLKEQMAGLLKDEGTREKILKDRASSMDSYLDKVNDLLRSSLYLPLIFYRGAFAHRGIVSTNYVWQFKAAEIKQRPRRLVPPGLLKTNIMNTAYILSWKMDTAEQTEFNTVIQNVFNSARNSYNEWLDEQSYIDEVSKRQALDELNKFFFEDENVTFKLSMTNYILIQRLLRFVNEYLTQLELKDFLSLQDLYHNNSLDLDALDKLFYENRGEEKRTLPITIGHLFKISE